MSSELPAVRASDAERDQTVELLRQSMVKGRLTLEEFTQRVEAVYGARTRTELELQIHDLPAETEATGRPGRSRPKRFTAVVFGSVERKGRWRVPRWTGLAAVFGDADIDLRTAEVEHPVVTITALLVFGNADFFVPAGVEVDAGGLTVFGHRREHGDGVPSTPDTPLIRIRVYSVFGTSDIWHVAPGESGSYRSLIKSVRARLTR